MKKDVLVRNFASISALLLIVQSIATPVFGDSSTAAYKEQMRAYHAKLLNRRKRIFEELKRCHHQKKDITNNAQQYLQMDNALLSGSSTLNDLCTQMEDNLALPHNVKD